MELSSRPLPAYARSASRRPRVAVAAPDRRKRAVWAIVGGLLSAAIAFLSLSFVPGADAVPGVEQVRNILGLVNTRSPGQRGAAEFLKHEKSASAATAADIPEQQALGKIFDDPGPKGPLEETLLALAPPPFVAPGTSGVLTTEPVNAYSAPSYAGGGAPGAYSFGGGGGGGGDGGGRGSFDGGGAPNPTAVVPDEQVTTTAAVPEPQTWAMMFLGFGLCGAALRRRRGGQRFSACRA